MKRIKATYEDLCFIFKQCEGAGWVIVVTAFIAGAILL